MGMPWRSWRTLRSRILIRWILLLISATPSQWPRYPARSKAPPTLSTTGAMAATPSHLWDETPNPSAVSTSKVRLIGHFRFHQISNRPNSSSKRQLGQTVLRDPWSYRPPSSCKKSKKWSQKWKTSQMTSTFRISSVTRSVRNMKSTTVNHITREIRIQPRMSWVKARAATLGAMCLRGPIGRKDSKDSKTGCRSSLITPRMLRGMMTGV